MNPPKKILTAAIFIWISFIVILFTGLETFARYKLGYNLQSLRLEGSAYFEMDKTKIWNQKFVEEKAPYFKKWPIQLETFEASVSAPRYLFKPNLSMTVENGKLVPAKENDPIQWSSNLWGFRGNQFPVEKRKDTIRLVVLGASTTEGSQTDSQTYPFYLENELKELDFKVEVVNAGHHGFGMDDLLALFRERILPLKPDIVIFYEVSNNTNPGEWIKEKWTRWYSWDEGYGKLFSFLHQRSALIVFLTKRLGFESRQPPREPHTMDWDSSKETKEKFEQKVKNLIKISKENNIKLILTTFITVGSQDLMIDFKEKPDMWRDFYLKWYPFTPGEISLIYNGYNKSLKDLAFQENVPLIDLAVQYPKDPKYFVDHSHFMPEGNQLLASFIADYLEKEVLDENITLTK